MTLSKPQREIMRLLNDGATLKNSTYFYGFEMTVKGKDEKIYFRCDTINAMKKRGLIKEVKHICGTYLEVNTLCDC